MRTPCLCLALAVMLVLGSSPAARADFNYLRSIPAPDLPELPDCVTGLDHTLTSLIVVSSYTLPPSSGGSYLMLVDPATGTVTSQEELPGAPVICATNFWQSSCCAYQYLPGPALDYYWVGDQCGEIDGLTWTGSLTVNESDMLPGAPAPISMAAAGESLLVLDEVNRWVIDRYPSGEIVRMDTVSLTGGPAIPYAITVWRNHILVSGSPGGGPGASQAETEFGLWEYTMGGDLVAVHIARSPVACSPQNMTFFDGCLYVAAACAESIRVFEPTTFNQEVPPGDSIVVVPVPERVEVTFDSVSTGGTITGEMVGSDPCPPPDGVTFFSEFYHLTTTAHFDYAAEIAVSTVEALPPWVDPGLVRVFVRPSGGCRPYLDMTIAPIELPTTLMSYTRTKSEDDEFSVFALGVDLRPPRAVVELKFAILDSTLASGWESIPPVPRVQMAGLLDLSRDAYYRGLSPLAAVYADSIASIARAVHAIPHIYDPDVPGLNLAGRLVSDAHTLAFSLRFSDGQALPVPAYFDPLYIDESPDGYVRAYLDVPPWFDPVEVDARHIFVEHEARAIPESTTVGWYPTAQGLDVRRLRAVFLAGDIEAVLPPGGAVPVRVTCFINGSQVFGDAVIFSPGAGTPPPGADAEPGLVIKSDPSGSGFEFVVTPGGRAPVEVRIYSVKGELVRQLAAGGAEGVAAVFAWRGDNATGSRVSPGAYFIEVRLGSETLTRKLVLRR